MPKGKKTAADKQTTLKHDVLAEFNSAPYLSLVESDPTLIQALATMFKGAMKTAALDLPGAKKTQIGRLVYVVGERVSLYGIPKLFMNIVRSADMNRTPDVRTRAILPEWACRITVNFVSPIIKTQSVANLLNAGGITAGVGDFRPEKGAGNYGTFSLVNEDNKDLVRIMKMGRAAQVKAMANPDPYDDETMKLLAWYGPETKRRGFKVAV